MKILTRAMALVAALVVLCAQGSWGSDRDTLAASFLAPPMDCKPHTRWWWMGNALTKEEISHQLRAMHDQGIGGVEQITMGAVYKKGDVPYLSNAFFDLLRHAIGEAEGLGMKVSLNFGGPGWIWGGDWIPKEESNQSLLSSAMDVVGPTLVDGPLSLDATINPREPVRSHAAIGPEDRLIAVVAGRLAKDSIDPASIVVLTDHVRERRIHWEAPEGEWRIMAFWATLTEGGGAVNHIDKAAMTHYVEHLGAIFERELGPALGTTVDSLFGDSFEVPVHRNGIYWADTLPAEFASRKGYELITHLPALWWDMGTITPKVRYDVNEVLHEMGMEAFYGTFVPWCAARGVKSRVQPYGFVTDILEGAGAVDIPEMEITAGEKDAVPWFDTRVGPRSYTASGAHLYGRNIVSTEAYTYMHWQPYRATLEELKIASDAFLRAGANKFYNHGFLATPETDIAPTRGFYAAIHISPDNVWWPYYHYLADYIARCCVLLREGDFHADVAVYSPLANQWTLDTFNARRWTRDFDWGDLGKLIIANGYNFDLVNDDVLQRLASFDKQELRIGRMSYRILILPNIGAMPVESLERVADYVKQGGVVIALEQAPNASCGMNHYETHDAEVKRWSEQLFLPPGGRDAISERNVGEGKAYRLDGVMDRSDPLDLRSSVFDPFLNVLRKHVTPDFGIDFVRQDWRENPGLSFIHRQSPTRDIYFVSNVQDHGIDMPIDFRVKDGSPWEWNPYTGKTVPLQVYEHRGAVTRVPLRLAPYAATCIVFERGEARPHVIHTSLSAVTTLTDAEIEGETSREGEHVAIFSNGEVRRLRVEAVPATVLVAGPWTLEMESPTFPRTSQSLNELVSWTEREETRHFSGTARYTTQFDLSKRHVDDGVRLELDLGDVGNVAEVRVNGTRAGVRWMRGQTVDITDCVVVGVNDIEIRVTNTLINRVSGLEAFPPVPPELRERLGAGLHEDRSPARELLGFSPLPRSGLLGPVEIRSYKKVILRLP